MKLYNFTDSNDRIWEVATLNPNSEPELLAPAPIHEYYSINDVAQHGEMWAHYADSYDQFIVYYCVKVKDYNEFIDQYLYDLEN